MTRRIIPITLLPIVASTQCFGQQQRLLVMPFPESTFYQCTRGPGQGSHAANFAFSSNDFDFAIAHGKDITAAAGGTAYVHRSYLESGCGKICTAGPRTGAKCENNSDCGAGGQCRSGNFGNHVTIDHGDGTFTLYGHLDKFNISDTPTGVAVAQGDVIGTANNSGYSCGNHLHFGLHAGDPKTDAINTRSVPIQRILIKNRFSSDPAAINTGSSLQCSEDLGHFYESVRSQTPTPCPPNFVDSFNRPNGSVGNGWIDGPGNANGNLVIRSGALTTPVSGDAGASIRRSIDLSMPVTLSAVLTHGNGFGGLLNRYTTSFSLSGPGEIPTGYGVSFFRGDQNFSSFVTVNGAQFASSFQFGAAITTTFTISPNGSITGSVSGDGGTFTFANGPIPASTPGSSLVIGMGFPDNRSSVITHPTVDNVAITYSCNSTLVYSQTTGGFWGGGNNKLFISQANGSVSDLMFYKDPADIASAVGKWTIVALSCFDNTGSCAGGSGGLEKFDQPIYSEPFQIPADGAIHARFQAPASVVAGGLYGWSLTGEYNDKAMTSFAGQVFALADTEWSGASYVFPIYGLSKLFRVKVGVF